MRGKIKLFILIGFLVFIVACTPAIDNGNNQDKPGPPPDNTMDWKNIQLKDVNTGETYKISDFSNKPVLVESFAVWCPTCTKQQKEIKKLHDKIGNAVVSISLDTDPNEDESIVKEHAQSNGFNWRYSVSPTEVTQLLIDEFGTKIINAPSAPVVFICKGETQLLRTGVKPAEELESLVNSC